MRESQALMSLSAYRLPRMEDWAGHGGAASRSRFQNSFLFDGGRLKSNQKNYHTDRAR